MAETRHGKTVFVRNLPYSTTNEELEKIFSEVGPIKSCFVVKEKETGKCRGFGYVAFTILEDAKKALEAVKKVNGRPVQIMFANKKEKQKAFGQPQKPDTQETSDRLLVDRPVETANSQPNKISKKRNKEKKIIPVKGLKQDPNPLTEGKRARLIVRNLAFKCTAEELKKNFAKYGEVVEVHIPKKASGTKLGFGFVQYRNKTQAGMAVKEANGQEICGRTVAVDWALPKDKYESKLAVKPPTKDMGAEEQPDDAMELDEDQPSEDDGSDDLGNDSAVHSEDDEIDNDSNEQDNDKDDDDFLNIDDSSSEDEEEGQGKLGVDNSDMESADEEDEDDFKVQKEGQSDSDESGIGDEASKQTKKRERESDVSQGRTVFVRNLPYTVGDEELEEFFSQFGEVKYGRIVIDKNSQMPKGSAFVQFQTKGAADACIKAASKQGDSGLSLGGRSILVNLAVDRLQVGQLVDKEKKKEEKDSRNLYLAREGMIRAGTAAAKDVPPGDMVIRTKIDAAKRQKLKDQNVFVSSTRLCVHNIPPTTTDQQLRAILMKAAGNKSARLIECRIMRDLTRLNSLGVGKSRGYAFCAFNQHEHAVSALRNLNNNPNIFGQQKRPIVEFSLENRKALESKQKRLEKSRAKLKQKTQGKEQESAKVNKTRKRKNKADKAPLERKQEQDQVARSLHKGPLGLPSHSGPKQRHKPRPSQQGGTKKAKIIYNKNNSSVSQQTRPTEKKPHRENQVKAKNSKKQKTNYTDNFDKLVAAYKQKIMASAHF